MNDANFSPVYDLATGDHNRLFSFDPDLNHPSPASSVPSPSYQPQLHQHAAVNNWAFTSNNPMIPPFPQVEPVIGPDRVMRRRQRAAHDQAIFGRQLSVSSNFTRNHQDPLPHRRSDHYSASTAGLRPQTLETAKAHVHRNHLSHSIDNTLLSNNSPGYELTTPTTPFSYHSAPPESKPGAQTITMEPLPEFPSNSSASLVSPTGTSYEGGPVRTSPTSRVEVPIRWRRQPQDSRDAIISKHSPINTTFPGIEADLELWLNECYNRQIPITDALIRNKAKEVAQKHSISDKSFKASVGRIENFKRRQGIKNGKLTGDGIDTYVRHIYATINQLIIAEDAPLSLRDSTLQTTDSLLSSLRELESYWQQLTLLQEVYTQRAGRSISFTAFHDASAQNSVRTCFSGTREHVLETIHRCIDNPSAERIVWMHGPVGAGKSVIAQTVASTYGREKVAATFFFYRSDPSRNDGNLLFPTIAWQLAISIPAIQDYIFHSLKKHPSLLRKDVETQFEELIIRPFLALNERTSAVQQQAPVVIIDGIDECIDESLQQRILEIIGTAVKNPHLPLRFLISSRPEVHIEETINRLNLPILRIDLASLRDANSDVEYYLRTQFARIASEKGLDPTWPGQEIVQDLVFRSAGQFLYVADVIRLVGEADNGTLAWLDMILGLELPHIVSPLARLDRSYLEILIRVRDQDFLKTFLGLLVARCSISRETDSLSDDYALLMDTSRVDLGNRLRQMHSILKFEPYIDIYYPSFLEFLQDSSRSHQYHVSKSAGTRQYLELMMKLLIERAARLTRQPDFHGTDHFVPEFGKLINRNPQIIGLNVEGWEQTLRPLLNVLDKLLGRSEIESLMEGYCQHCQFYQIIYNILTHLKHLQKKENPDVERYLKSLERIIKHGDPGQQNFDMNFGRVFTSGAIVGLLMAILAHRR